jgi:hypothetical protein
MTGRSTIESPAVEVGRWSAVTLLGVLVLAATVICWRRLAGALESPLPATSLAAIGLLLGGVAAAARLLWRRAASGDAASAPFLALVRWLPLPAVAVAAAALSVPGTSPGGLAALWATLAIEETGVLLGFGGGKKGVRNLLPVGPDGRFPKKVPDTFSSATFSSAPADEVTQQLTRSQSADGVETLSGWLRVGLDPGQRSANVHVAFCPPFGRTPTLEVTQSAGPPSRIKTVQLLPFGARVDLKLTQAGDEPASVLLRFSAQSKPAGPTEPT